MANATPTVTTITKTANKEKAPDAAPRVNILDFCEEHYEDTLPIIMEKARCDKQKEVQTRLDFGENSKKTRRERENSLNSRAENSPTRFHPQRSRTHGREKQKDKNVFNRLNHRRKSVHERLNHLWGVEESYGDTYSQGTRTKYRDRFRSVKRWRESEPPSSRGSESSTSNRGYWKSRTKRRKLVDEDDFAVPWTCEDVDPFTPRICNFKSSRKTRIPNNIKTYDGTGDPEDHLKVFQAATQQKKYVKDLVEIHNIKQRDGETIEDFMERFKVETGRMKGAPECMRISEFMHGVNNPELTKRLNEHVPKTMEEMMTVTTAFIRGEVAVAFKKKCHSPWKSQDHSKWHAPERRSDFRGQLREGWGSSKFTPLTRTPKEILMAEVGKFKPPPPMVTLIEKRSSNKFCDFHNDKGHSTDECMQLKKQIEELMRAGKLSHLIKEIKQGRDQIKNGKKKAPAKDKSLAIYMIQPWQRMTRQKLTQRFACGNEITFPPLANNDGTEGPLIIEAEIGRHMIHRMYIDGGDANHSTKAWMNFMIMRSLSPYNGIIGRPGIREIQAVPSTAHGMLKFPANGGIEVAIEGTLSAEGRTKLCSLLKKNLDIFAWQPSNMTGVPRSVTEHRLNDREGYSPIRQKKRRQAPERAKAIQAEDCYPLPEIDWKVESLCCYPFKCFLDAYKGYHQIQMAESNEEKTVFHTSQGVYCYTKMPFGLKNAGATYQRLVDKASDSQVGRNLEVYVDDLVIKSHMEAEMIRNINETFRTLRRINMKLNPKKCTFGAREGMFLGYMISPEGIQLCPEKTKVVLQLPSLRTIKEVQSLNRKLASLNRSGKSLQAAKATLVGVTLAGSTKTKGGTDCLPGRLSWSY
ncbi:reverse transcriptase domain-containing protein [Tanacetum coccineum]